MSAPRGSATALVMSWPRSARVRGFTLLELLVAIAIFALVAVMAYGGLNAVMRQSTTLAENERELRRAQAGLRQIQADLFQIIDRPLRDDRGDEVPVLAGGVDAALPLQFTRIGQPNPTDAVRSALERVLWVREEDRLVRFGWSPVDGRPFARLASADSRQVLLEGIETLELLFYDDRNVDSPVWPPANRPDARLPRAIELRLTLKGEPPLRLTFDLPAEWPEAETDDDGESDNNPDDSDANDAGSPESPQGNDGAPPPFGQPGRTFAPEALYKTNPGAAFAGLPPEAGAS
ncbi:MAG: type II secretion system minor pseudopilin GspJ [Halothiobacillaceae bacterium]